MNFDRSLIFSYLEEDNIQRAYFRVRPLLTLDGDVRQEAVQLWPNEGGLRIVPDRNEQHTFKTRMRTLGSYCVIDLRDQPPEAGKIRTNKNFHPDRGEVNQFILYSDTVHELPENTFYQLIDGSSAEYAALAEKAITPLFYIQQEDTLYGPVNKQDPVQPETAQEAAGMLYELPCPDGVIRKIFCMKDAAPAENKYETEDTVAVPEKLQDSLTNPVAETASSSVAQEAHTTDTLDSQPEQDELPIGETLQILDQAQGHDETLKQLDKPVSSDANLLHQKEPKQVFETSAIPKKDTLGGTPLVRTPLHVSIPQTKNRTQEVISNQWNIGKYEPPAQNLPVGTAMRAVENPVESACNQLREAWNTTSAHDQLTDCMLSLEGVRAILEDKLCSGRSGSMMQRVLRQRLQDLEAERLTALCELDRARRDADAYKQEILNALSARINRETAKLEADRKTAENIVASLKQEVNSLTLQRDALLGKVNEIQTATLPEAVAKLVAEAQMALPVSGQPLRMSPVSGQTFGLDELISRIQVTCSRANIEVDRNTAIALLVLLAISPRIGFSCPTPAPAATLSKNIAAAFGWQNSFAHQIATEQQPCVGIRPVDAVPSVLMTSLSNYAPIPGTIKLFLTRNTANLIRNAAYDVSQWPILMLPALPFVEEIQASTAIPVSASSLARLTEHESVSAEEFASVMNPVFKATLPLSGSAHKEMYKFVSICTGLMEGGLPVAVDWAIMLWIIPALERGSKCSAAVKAVLDEYPLSLTKL